MKEYTILAIVSVAVTIILDRVTGVNILRKKEFYLFLTAILFFKFLVNG